MPIVVVLPASLVPIFCDEFFLSWELHRIVKAWVDLKYTEMKHLVRPIL